MHKTDEDWAYSSGDMLADGHTNADRQTGTFITTNISSNQYLFSNPRDQRSQNLTKVRATITADMDQRKTDLKLRDNESELATELADRRVSQLAAATS